METKKQNFNCLAFIKAWSLALFLVFNILTCSFNCLAVSCTIIETNFWKSCDAGSPA